MSKSIMQTDKSRCYLCREPASYNDPLDKHHVFGGANRRKSEHYGLTVYLHHSACHIFGKCAVHNDSEVCRRLQREAQKAVMKKYGWTVDEFRAEFGKNYL